tara:strand:+ start:2866 stop:4182 length:1317 start_codon:yes stop_codon:yes gene_type:complete
MAADRTLIYGARQVADAKAAKGRKQLEATSGLVDAATGIVTDFLDYSKEKTDEYKGYAQKVLDEAGHLPASEYSALYDTLMEDKNSYIYGGPKGQALSIRDLNMKAEDYGEYKDIRMNLSQLTLDGNAEGEKLSQYFSGTPEGQAYLDILKDNSRMIQKTCPEGEENCSDKGRMGVMMPGKDGEEEWVSMSTLKQNINKNLFDGGFQTGLDALVEVNQQASMKLKEGEVLNFPEKIMEQKVNNLVSRAENRRSVAYDEMFGNTSFYEDLSERLETENYKGLGIDPNLLDPTKGDGITREDAKQISQMLIEDPQYADLLVNEMTTYYTGFLRQNFNDASAARVTTAPGYEMTKGGRYIKSTPGSGGSGDFPLEVDNEDEFASGDVTEQNFSQYDNISVGGVRLSDMLREAESKEERDELIRIYGNVMPSPKTTVQPTAE